MKKPEPVLEPPTALLQNLLRRNREGEKVGICSVCSAHPKVLEAAARQASADGPLLLIESTSSQVNHLGGYTGKTPAQFAALVHDIARRAGLSPNRVLLGGDHLGPYPWRSEAAEAAMHKAGELVRACVLAGYKKIHLDASMACAHDGSGGPDEPTIASRAALLCRAAENAAQELPSGDDSLLYVIGSEVPTPGGETIPGEAPAVTPPQHVAETLSLF